jgi:hypothetical protein
VQTANRAQKSGQIRQTKVGAQVSIGLFRRRSDLSITAPGMPTEQANAALMGFVSDYVDYLDPDGFFITPTMPLSFQPGFRFGAVPREEFMAVISHGLASIWPGSPLIHARGMWAAPDTEFWAYNLIDSRQYEPGGAENCVVVSTNSRLAMLRSFAHVRGLQVQVDEVRLVWRLFPRVEQWRLLHEILSDSVWGGWRPWGTNVADREGFGNSLNRLLWLADLLTTVRAHVVLSSGGLRGKSYWTNPVEERGLGANRWSPVPWVVQSIFPDVAEITAGSGMDPWWDHIETFASLYESDTTLSIGPDNIETPGFPGPDDTQIVEFLGSRQHGRHRIDVFRTTIESLDPDAPDFGCPPYSSIVMRIVGETGWERRRKRR